MIQLQTRMREASPTTVAEAALQAGASNAQILQLAKEQGASISELEHIQSQLIGSTSMTLNPQLSNILEQAIQSGASNEQVLKIAISQGASSEEIANIQANLISCASSSPNVNIAAVQAAVRAGATPDQILREAKSNGASNEELAEISAAMLQDSGGGGGILSSIQNLTTNDKVNHAVEAAILSGADPELIAKVAKANGATKSELVKIAKTVETQRNVQIAANHGKGVEIGANSADQGHLSRSINNIVQQGIQSGASKEQILKNVRNQGASLDELNQIQSTLLQSTDLSQQEELGIIAEAISSGASEAQVLDIAKSLGLSSQEDLAKIKRFQQNSSCPPLTSNQSLNSALNLSMQSGASMEQILALAKSKGASAKELVSIKEGVVMRDATAAGSLTDVMLSNNPEVNMAIKAAIETGASKEQTLRLAKASGASQQELKQIEKSLQGGVSRGPGRNQSGAGNCKAGTECFEKSDITAKTEASVFNDMDTMVTVNNSVSMSIESNTQEMLHVETKPANIVENDHAKNNQVLIIRSGSHDEEGKINVNEEKLSEENGKTMKKTQHPEPPKNIHQTSSAQEQREEERQQYHEDIKVDSSSSEERPAFKVNQGQDLTQAPETNKNSAGETGARSKRREPNTIKPELKKSLKIGSHEGAIELVHALLLLLPFHTYIFFQQPFLYSEAI